MLCCLVKVIIPYAIIQDEELTSLMLACKSDNSNSVQTLLSSGAKVNEIDSVSYINFIITTFKKYLLLLIGIFLRM